MPHSAFLSHDFEIGADLLKVRIECRHPYYKGSVCPDLSFELPPDSKEMLQRHNILYKEKGHTLEFARKKKGVNDENFVTDLPNSSIDILVRVNNPRFLLVTDFIATKKNPAESLLFDELNKNEKNQLFFTSDGKRKVVEKKDALKYGFPSPFAVLVINLNNITDAEEIVLPFEAKRVTLKYTLYLPTKEIMDKKTTELFEELQLGLQEVIEDGDNGITLSVHYKDEKVCVLTSTDRWMFREENMNKNKGYLTFKMGAAYFFLPFPGRITSQTIKNDTIEQEVRLPRVLKFDNKQKFLFLTKDQQKYKESN